MLSGVYGARYLWGGPLPEPVGDAIVAFEDPMVRWIRAAQLVRELHDCTIVSV